MKNPALLVDSACDKKSQSDHYSCQYQILQANSQILHKGAKVGPRSPGNQQGEWEHIVVGCNREGNKSSPYYLQDPGR